MSLDLLTLQNQLAFLERDHQEAVSNIAAHQAQIQALAGMRDYLVLAQKRMRDQITAVTVTSSQSDPTK